MQNSNPETWSQVTPADLLRSVFRRLPSVCFTALLVTVIVTGLLIVWPNKYGSDGMMYVRLGRGALSVDPTTQNTTGVSLMESRSAEVISVAEMLSSREIAERVVDIVGPEEINRPRNWIDDSMLWAESLLPASNKSGGKMSDEDYESQIQRELAIRRIAEWVEVEIPKDGYTVEISGRGNDPILVQQIVQETMNQYGRYHVEAHQSTGSLEFFEKQVDESRDVAVAANEKLQTTRSDMGWLSVESAEEKLRQRMVALEVALDEADSGYAESKSRADGLKNQLVGLKQWMEMEVTRGVANNATDAMRGQLYTEELAESEELASLRPDHPRFRLLQEKMQRSKQIVGDETKERELTREAINPVRQELESEFLLAQAKATGLKSKRDALKKSLENAQGELQRLNSDAITLAKLKWQADIGEQNFLQHAKSLEEARIIRELDQQNMSDVSVIQNASLNLKKVGPPRALLACVGACLGLVLGLLQAIARDTPVSPSTAKSTAQSKSSNSTRASGREIVDGDDEESRERISAGVQQEEVLVNPSGGKTSEAPLPR